MKLLTIQQKYSKENILKILNAKKRWSSLSIKKEFLDFYNDLIGEVDEFTSDMIFVEKFYLFLNYPDYSNQCIVCKNKTPFLTFDKGYDLICSPKCSKLTDLVKSRRSYGPRITRRKTQKTILAEFRTYWGDRYNYSMVRYQGTNNKVKIICDKHGIFEMEPHRHKKGSGCYKCGRIQSGINTGNKLRKTLKQFIIESNSLYGKQYDYSESIYIQARKEIIIGCMIHGNFKTTPQRHLDGYGCPLCIKQCSIPETDWLNSLKIPDTLQNRCVNLKIDGKKCLVDGYDPSTNTVYEFYGDFWHGNPEIYNKKIRHPIIKEKTFGDLYERTKLKEKRIKKAGYNLITIWEYDWNQ